MHRPQPRIRQGQATAGADPGHIVPRFRSVVFNHGAQRGQPLRDRRLTQRIRHRRRFDRQIRFDHLRDRIQPRRKGDAARCALHQPGIHDGDIGNHPRVAQADLDPVFRHGNHRVLGDLCPRARRGRQRDHRQRCAVERFAAPYPFEVVQRCPRAGDQRRERLGKVDHRSAAKCYNHIRPICGHTGECGFQRWQAWLGPAALCGDRQTSRAAILDQPSRARCIGPVHDQHMRPKASGQRGRLRGLSTPEMQRLRREEREHRLSCQRRLCGSCQARQPRRASQGSPERAGAVPWGRRP